MNNFQFEAMLRPSFPRFMLGFLPHLGFFHLNRTNSASSAGNPPIKNSGRQPQRKNEEVTDGGEQISRRITFLQQTRQNAS